MSNTAAQDLSAIFQTGRTGCLFAAAFGGDAPVKPGHRSLAAPAGQLHQRRRMRTRVPNGIRQNCCQEIESATSRPSAS